MTYRSPAISHQGPRYKLSQQNDAATDALARINARTTDREVAEKIAAYLMTMYPPPYLLSVIHDAWSKGAVRDYERMRKKYPDLYDAREPVGPCPLRFDWKRKNIFGIRKRDEETARAWIIDAAIRGYSVFRSSEGFKSLASGSGSIAACRQRASAQRNKQFEIRNVKNGSKQ